MRASSKKSLITTGTGILGAVAGGVLAGNPMLGYKAGSLLGTAASGFIAPDTPERVDRFVHPYLSPSAGFSSAPVARPMMQTSWQMPQETRADNLISAIAPIAGSASALLMGDVMKNKTPLFKKAAAGVPSAKDGTFIPPDAPSHEEGGVKLVKSGTGKVMAEAQGNEYIIPGERINEILSSQNPSEVGLRFIAEIQRLKAKGQSEFMASDGLRLSNLFAPNEYASFNRHLAGIPFAQAPQDIIEPASDTDMLYSEPQDTPMYENLAQQLSAPVVPSTTAIDDALIQRWAEQYPHRNQSPWAQTPNISQPSPFFNTQINLAQGSGVRGNRDPQAAPATDYMTDYFNQAIAAQERANRQGNLLRFGHGLINLRGLMEPMLPSKPFTMAPLKRVELEDPSPARINQLDREVGIGLEALSQLSAPERIAGLSGLISNYGQAMGQISDARSGIMNRQAEINHQIAMQEQQAQMQAEALNRQTRAAESAVKHQRNQMGLMGISDSITGMIESSAQKDSNIKELSLIKSMLDAARTEQERMNIRAMFSSMFD